MNYYLFATKFETANLLDSATIINDNLYQLNKYNYIFITGIGKEEVQKNIPIFNNLAQDAKKIINIGIAGAINKDLQKSHSYQIGQLQHNNQIYTLGEGRKLCSFSTPVWHQETRQIALNQQADLVDMEAFFIYEALSFKNYFHCLKFVSDFCHKSSEQNFKNDAKLAINEIEKFVIKSINENNN